MKKLIVCLLLLTITFTNHLADSQFAKCLSGEQCIPFKDCEPLKALTLEGRLTPEERAHIRSKQCNSINYVAYVCCGGNASNVIQNPGKFSLPKPPVCGSLFDNRLLGGEKTNIDEFPWIAQIQYSKPGNKISSHCGGSLINERFVLTAAHCDRRVPKTWKIVQVRLGEWDTRSNPDCQNDINEIVCNDPYVEVPVSQVIVHENYNPDARNQPNDIALLKLQRNVQYTDFIAPICLPDQTSLTSIDFTSHTLEIAGFGKTESESSSPVKLRVVLYETSQNTCRDFYSTQDVSISNSQLCAAGEEGRDSCVADSGSSLMKHGLYSNSPIPYYMLVGVISFGPRNCGIKSVPGVYTRVSEYVDWIKTNMK